MHLFSVSFVFLSSPLFQSGEMAPNASLTDNMMGTLELPLPAEYQMGGGGYREQDTCSALQSYCNASKYRANARRGRRRRAAHKDKKKSWSRANG